MDGKTILKGIRTSHIEKLYGTLIKLKKHPGVPGMLL